MIIIIISLTVKLYIGPTINYNMEFGIEADHDLKKLP